MDSQNNTQTVTPSPVSAPAPEAAQPAPAPAQIEAPAPVYVGNSNIVDRSGIQHVYTSPDPSPANAVNLDDSPRGNSFAEASNAFSEAIVVITGVLSAVGFSSVAYFSKNSWVGLGFSATMAVLAVFFSFKNYRSTEKLSPLTAIGLTSATFSLLIIANYFIIKALIKAALSQYGY